MGTKRLNRAAADVFDDLMRHYAEKDDNASKGEFDYGTYQDADGGNDVVIADWWDAKFKRLAKFLQDNYRDVAMVWSDTNVTCDTCGKVINTNPTHYGWLPNYIYLEGDGCHCQDCVLNAPTDFIDDATNSTKTALLPWMVSALTARGWVCFEPETHGCARYETGLRAGQNDDPKAVKAYMQSNLPGHDVVFVITDSGQFDINWTAYVKKREED